MYHTLVISLKKPVEGLNPTMKLSENLESIEYIRIIETFLDSDIVCSFFTKIGYQEVNLLYSTPE